MAFSQPCKDLLVSWRTGCNQRWKAYYYAAQRYSQRDYYLGLPAIVLGALISVAAFAVSRISAGQDIALYAIGVAGATVTALHVFQQKLGYGKRGQGYLAISKRYEKLARLIDKELAIQEQNEDMFVKDVSNIFDAIMDESEPLPLFIFETHKIHSLYQRESDRSTLVLPVV
jgi:hypothetical protein